MVASAKDRDPFELTDQPLFRLDLRDRRDPDLAGPVVARRPR